MNRAAALLAIVIASLEVMRPSPASAQVVSQRMFSQTLSRRELLGMVLVVAGVGLLLATQV